jgi:hypothetical protein
MFLCFLPLGRVNVSHGFFKLGGITLHLNFTNIDFIIVRNIWFSYSLRLSGALATGISWPLLPKDNWFYKVLCNKILVYIIHPPCGIRFLCTMLPQIVPFLIFLFWVQFAKTHMVHLTPMVHLAPPLNSEHVQYKYWLTMLSFCWNCKRSMNLAISLL